MRLTRNNKNNTDAKKRGILKLLSAPTRYIKHKIESAYKKIVKKEPKKTFKAPNILENEVYNEENLKGKSIDELKEIAKLRRIKNRGKLKKEGLIISILKSEGSNAERNYMKHFNINTNVNNNNNNNNNNDNNVNDDDNDVNHNNDVNNSTNDDDDKIRDKVSDIRARLSRLGNIATKDDRDKKDKELHEKVMK